MKTSSNISQICFWRIKLINCDRKLTSTYRLYSVSHTHFIISIIILFCFCLRNTTVCCEKKLTWTYMCVCISWTNYSCVWLTCLSGSFTLVMTVVPILVLILLRGGVGALLNCSIIYFTMVVTDRTHQFKVHTTAG